MRGWIKLTRVLGNDDVWFQISHIEQVYTAAGLTQIVLRGQKTAVQESLDEVMARIGNAA